MLEFVPDDASSSTSRVRMEERCEEESDRMLMGDGWVGRLL